MKRILIVDDDQKWLNLFSSIISSMGFEVAVADSGDKALKQFQEKPFDLVLTDLNMPGMAGWEVARHIKGISPNTLVVLATAGGRELILEKMEESSIDAVFFKHFGLKEFKETVQTVLNTS
jgi:two-component system capsular synthesis sensor histidine kinase RcsC